MADRFPLILNTSANQIQEIASGDTLDLTGNNISNAGVITATSFSGPIVAGAGTSNITAGIITAVTFKGDGDLVELDVDGHTNLDNVNISGVSTFAGAIDLNSDLDVDGHTNLDNVSIAGVVTATTFSGSGASLTGIANVNVASNAAIAGTKISPNFGAQNIVTTGQLQINGALPTIVLNDENNENDFELRNQNGSFIIRDIDNPQTRYTIASSGMIHTFHGAASFSSNLDVGAGIDVTGNSTFVNDIDVDGHTNLDNVNVVGVLTVTGAVNASHSTFGNLNTTGITIENTNATILFQDTNNNPDYWAAADNGVFDIVQYNNGGSNINVVKINTDGHIDIATNVDFAAGIDVTGNVIASGNVSGVNGVFSGNVSVGGVLTYEDVTNVDSVGIVTARNGIKVLAGGANVAGVVTATGGVFVPDNNQIQLGNAAGSADLRIYHQSSNNHSYISETGSGSLIVLADDFYVQDTSTNTMISAKEGAESNLHFNGGTPKLSTTNTGISVTGRADISTGLAVGTSGVQSSNVVSIKGAVSNQLNIADSSNNSWGLLLTQSQASGGYHATTNSGVGKPCAIVNVNADALHFGTTNTLRWTIDNTGHFYPGGNGHLDIGKSGSQVKTIFATGAVVTGVVTATSFSGDGSNLTGVLVGITTEQVTPSSNVATLNLAKDDHKIVASGTYTIDVSGGTEASSHTLRIENSGTANVGFSTFFKFPSGGTPSLPTASGAISLVSFQVHKVGSVGIATVLLAGASVNFS